MQLPQEEVTPRWRIAKIENSNKVKIANPNKQREESKRHHYLNENTPSTTGEETCTSRHRKRPQR